MRWRHRRGKRLLWITEVVQLVPAPIKNPRPILLTREEIEVLKLVDYEKLTQEEAALKLGISRPTISKLVNSGRKKLIQAIIEGRPIQIV